MAKLDSKKIDSMLKSIIGIMATAVKTLNEMTDGDFKGSTLGSDPLSLPQQIIQVFLTAQALVANQSKYEGKSVDEITQIQEVAHEAELTEIQEHCNQRLVKRKQKPELEAEPESTYEGDDTPHL